MSASQYANPANKGAFVNKLDFVVLAALEIDTKFNVNVLTGSDGVLRGAPGGHPDTAAGSKVCIIVTPLVRGPHGDGLRRRCDRHDAGRLRGCAGHGLRNCGQPAASRPHQVRSTMRAFRTFPLNRSRRRLTALWAAPDPVQFKDKVVAVLEARDGTILDVVREIKPYTFED